MKRKIKQSFTEVVSGEPHKEHIINVVIVTALASIIGGMALLAIFTFLHIK